MKVLITVVAFTILMLSGYTYLKNQVLDKKVHALSQRQVQLEALMNAR